MLANNGTVVAGPVIIGTAIIGTAITDTGSAIVDEAVLEQSLLPNASGLYPGNELEARQANALVDQT